MLTINSYLNKFVTLRRRIGENSSLVLGGGLLHFNEERQLYTVATQRGIYYFSESDYFSSNVEVINRVVTISDFRDFVKRRF